MSRFVDVAMTLAATLCFGIDAGFCIGFICTMYPCAGKNVRQQNAKNLGKVMENNDVNSFKEMLKSLVFEFERDIDKKHNTLLRCLHYAAWNKQDKMVELILDALGEKQRLVQRWQTNLDTLILGNDMLHLLLQKAQYLVANSAIVDDCIFSISDFKTFTPCLLAETCTSWKTFTHRYAKFNDSKEDYCTFDPKAVGKFYLIAFRRDIVSIVLANPDLPNLLLVELVEMICEPGVNCMTRYDINRVINVIKGQKQ